MGLRFRTPIGSLREQRRKAEGQPPLEAGRATATRYRNTESLGDSSPSAVEFDKREGLIERLRSVLASDCGSMSESMSEYQVIQDELARISHHQQANRKDASKGLIDLNLPSNMFFDSSAPFRYVVIEGGKTSDDFVDMIPKLASAPSNLDSYIRNIRHFEDQSPRSIALTLLISSDVEKVLPKPLSDPSQEAANLTQSNVTYNNQAKEPRLLSKSLVLSLLDDK